MGDDDMTKILLFGWKLGIGLKSKVLAKIPGTEKELKLQSGYYIKKFSLLFVIWIFFFNQGQKERVLSFEYFFFVFVLITI